MSTYTTVDAVPSYIEGFTISDRFALERLIRRCETDIDRIITPINPGIPPTQVISIPGATGGTFTLSYTLNGVVYTTAALPFDSPNLAAAINGLPSMVGAVDGVIGINPWTVVWSRQWTQANFGSSVNWVIPLLTVDASAITPTSSASVSVEKGRKVNPLVDLNENQVISLSNATCAQVEYRMKMGSTFFVRAQFESVRGPDFTTTGKMPDIGPEVRRELAQSGLLWVGGRAYSGVGRRGVGRGWPTY